MFSKKIENMFSVFLSSYRNTCESLGELEKAMEQYMFSISYIFLKDFLRILQTSTLCIIKFYSKYLLSTCICDDTLFSYWNKKEAGQLK